jgi:hypothetical protein
MSGTVSRRPDGPDSVAKVLIAAGGVKPVRLVRRSPTRTPRSSPHSGHSFQLFPRLSGIISFQ